MDVALLQAFGPRWRNVEGVGREITAEDLAALLHEEPDLCAVSSHTFRPPFTLPGDIRLLPIVLLRHPLDRVRSAYEFERQQISDTFGAVLAKQHDFAGYVAALLGRPGDRSIRDFQTFRLSHLPGNAPDGDREELLSALACVNSLPFIGLVENYDFSIQVFARLLSREMGALSFDVVRANTIRAAEDPLPARLAAAEAALGPALTAAFHAANRHDQHLFDLVRWMHARMQDG